MKKISRKAIAKVVKEEYKAARKWCDQDWRRYYKMMLDTSDGEIWSDVFLDVNEWKQYHSKSIRSLDCGYGHYVKEKEIGYIDDAIRKLEEAGWEITEQ